MSTLFDATDLETGAAGSERRVGHRLARLELLNWGTFDQRVWSFDPGGADSLLTGDIGSGKSTVVDALTTLMVPPARIAFNRAAGAEARERSLRSYVLGNYKTERNEATGATGAVGLRRGPTFSVLLAVFDNAGYDTQTSLAVVLWLGDGQEGQPDRFYVTAERAMSVTGDLAGFGGDPAELRKRLRASGAAVHEGYRSYGERMRRLLGIPSEQALELFAQTVSMKAVSNLTEFVRAHMLEPFDAQARVDQLVGHFDALTKAHEAVVAARTQLQQLEPLLATAATYEQLSTRIESLAAQRDALPAFVADRTVSQLVAEADAAAVRLAVLAAEQEQLDTGIGQAAAEVAATVREMDGHGGARIREIEVEVGHVGEELDRRRAQATALAADLVTLGLPPVESAEAFSRAQGELQTVQRQQDDLLADARGRADRLAVAVDQLTGEEVALNAELRAARERRVNIPVAQLDLRGRLLAGTGLSEADLPYAGELLRVRPGFRDWEGAAERVLRGLALSLLVPEKHYRAVSDWIEGEHLRGRVVYYAVPTGVQPAPVPRSGHPLADVVEVRDVPFAGWLWGEVAARADLERVETMADFRRADRAVTRSGQIKGGRRRHEKDDRFRIDDRRNYVLGWSAEARIDALLEAGLELTTRRRALDDEARALRVGEKTARARAGALDRALAVSAFSTVDWAASAARIDQLHAERDRLTAASGELARLQALRDAAAAHESELRERRDLVVRRWGAAEGERTRALALAQARRALARTAADLPDAVRDDLVAAVAEPAPSDVTGWDEWEKTTGKQLNDTLENAHGRRTQATTRLTAAMRDFRQAWPALTGELDDAPESIAGYREMHVRLTGDDLPRFEAEFRELLRTNAIRDIAGFRSELHKQADLIRERIDQINGSLHGIEYNPGRYIRLETEPTINAEVRQFIADLRACTDNAFDAGGDDDTYSEQKFHQVRALVERFRGREGFTDVDRRWAALVTDVRSWVMFSAVERWTDTDEAHETYTDSGGKSGGQKEKLAYTVLAASLAYQFKLDWAASRSRSFQMAVIDEAFGRGSDESTRYALALFRRLGLQLIVVTPLQKIHTIEPAVSAVGFVDNPTGAGSRMHTLTVEEYRAGRAAHQASARDS